MAKPVSVENAEHYVWGEECDGWHLVRHDALSVIQERIPPGRGEVRHFHHYVRQFFFVLDGEATLRVGEQTVILGAHQGYEVAPGVPHELFNAAARDVVFLVVSSPRSHGDRQELPSDDALGMK